MFGRTKSPPLESKDLRRMGRLEAQVESLELKWTNYRDEIKKLVNRLEKREQRAEKKELAEAEKNAENPIIGTGNGVDEVTARVLARRNRALPT